MKIKVCGMRDSANIRSLATLKPDYMGFIFYSSSKRFAENLDKEVIANLTADIKKTGVFVNAGIDEIKENVKAFQLDAVQLHGTEPIETCRLLKNDGIEVIKAFGIDDYFSFQSLIPYSDAVDYFLFDTKTSRYGGSGETFNWDVLKHYSLHNPFFLSGGLSLENLPDVMKLEDTRLYAVDLNSKFEIQPGIKDMNHLTEAISTIRGCAN